MTYLIKPPAELNYSEPIVLPSSKSLSNRILLIQALSGADFQIDNISDCDDTRVMIAALKDSPEVVDIGAAGTAMRFLTAYYAQLDGEEHVITGTARMKQRPIGILVDALRQLGADITYEGEEGYPPLRIRGTHLEGGAVELAGDVSSQYISALLMIAPLMEKGLELKMSGEVASRPYINMTLGLMKRMGAESKWIMPNLIHVPHSDYAPVPYVVEGDWSAASYWYEIKTAYTRSGSVTIGPLEMFKTSLQGDAEAINVFYYLNTISLPTQGNIRLKFRDLNSCLLQLNFADAPDLAQAVIVTCCLINRPFIFTGLRSLRIKETDRIAALITELRKLGYVLQYDDDEDMLIWMCKTCRRNPKAVIKTYEDHRMAMAFAPACIKFKEVRIEHPEVVSKSYPGYWDDLRRVGFVIEELTEEKV